MEYYVYIYIDPRHNTPFYVGKGCGNRLQSHLEDHALSCDNLMSRKIKKLRRYGIVPDVKICFSGLPEDIAFDIEKDLIFVIGRRDLGLGQLCNHTDGGDGSSGHKMSKSGKEKIRQYRTGKTASDETRLKISRLHKGKTVSRETRRKIGSAHKGKMVSDKTKEKMRQLKLGTKLSLETKLKISQSWTDERREQQRQKARDSAHLQQN